MTFLPFERDAIKVLLTGRVSQAVLDGAIGPGLPVSVDESGAGYFALAKHDAFSTARTVFSSPLVMAKFEGMTVGFVVFIEAHTLTLECHGFGDVALPPGMRSLEWACEASNGRSAMRPNSGLRQTPPSRAFCRRAETVVR